MPILQGMDAAVHLVLRDADPNGIVTATRDNWTGKAFSLPIADLGLMKELLRGAGVYVLVGVLDDENETPAAYVGEAEEVLSRLTSRHQQFSRGEVTWQRVVVFVSQAEDIHKAHIKWLEAKLVELARAAGRVALTNSTTPTPPNLPEFDRVFAEAFLANMLVLYPLLGVRAFIPGSASIRTQRTEESSLPTEELLLKKGGEVVARGRCTATGGVTLLAGSRITRTEAEYAGPAIQQTRQHFVDRGWLAEFDAEWWTLTEDFDCSSPSRAAAVVMGRPMQGPQAWRNANGTPGRLVVQFVMAPADPDGVCLVEVLVSIAAAHLVECEPRTARRRLGLKKYTVRQARRVVVERTEIREISEVDSRNHPRAAFVKCWPECARVAKNILESLRNEVHSGLLPSTVVAVDLPSEASGSVAVRRLRDGEYTYNALDLPIDRALEILRREPAPSIEDVKSYGIRPARQFKKRWQWHRNEYFEIIVDLYALTGAHQVAYEVRTNSGYSEADYNYGEDGDAAPEPTGFGIEMEDTGSDEGVIGFTSKDADGAAVGVSPSAFHEAVTTRLKSILPGLLEGAESFGYESGEPDLCSMKWVHGPDPAVREQIEHDIDGIDTIELYAFVVGSRD